MQLTLYEAEPGKWPVAWGVPTQRYLAAHFLDESKATHTKHALSKHTFDTQHNTYRQHTHLYAYPTNYEYMNRKRLMKILCKSQTYHDIALKVETF